jgi:hypothetical protein
MSNVIDSLIRDMLAWIGDDGRPYGEVLDAWRTSCPRLTVWEDAVERELVAFDGSVAGEITVKVTPAGQRFAAVQNCPSAI